MHLVRRRSVCNCSAGNKRRIKSKYKDANVLNPQEKISEDSFKISQGIAMNFIKDCTTRQRYFKYKKNNWQTYIKDKRLTPEIRKKQADQANI